MGLIKHTSDPAVQAIDMGMPGEHADMATKLYGPLLVKKQPFLGILLPNLKYLATMIKSSDMAGYYVSEGKCNLCAFYKHDDRFPIARAYYIQLSTPPEFLEGAKYLESVGLELNQLEDRMISEFIEPDDHEARVDSFFERIKSKSKIFEGLFDGRRKNTITESAMFLASDGCLVCGKKDDQLFSTTVAGNKGVLFGFHLCHEHAKECGQANSNLEYLSSVFGVAPPIRVSPMPRSEVVATASAMLVSELGCRIENTTSDTITATRIKSGFKLVCRLTSETDYGYMIFEPGREKDVARFDSARHHSVAYGPDHLHRNLKIKREKPESSFNTGYPLIDKVSLLAVLEEKEQEYFARNGYASPNGLA